MPGDRCEVVLYTPEHDATFSSLGVAARARVVDLWAERTAALGARDDVDYVLVFENRGAEVGATIAHPHGQIYAFGWCRAAAARAGARHRFDEPGDRLVPRRGWRAWVPEAPVFPYASGSRRRADARSAVARRGAARRPRRDPRRRARPARPPVRRRDAVHALDPPAAVRRRRLARARVHVEIVSPWRAKGVMRYVAAGELGSGVFFNPVLPEDAADALRNASA